MSVAELPIKIDRENIAEFCRARDIRKLSLFGSVVRDDFDPERSDVDVLVEFLPGQKPGWEFFHWGEDNGTHLRTEGGSGVRCGGIHPVFREEEHHDDL